MSGEHRQNSGGIPTFIDREFIGYLICDCKPWQGYWALPIMKEDMYRPIDVKDMELMATQALMQVEFKFSQRKFKRGSRLYTCWIAEVCAGEKYIYDLSRDQFLSFAEAHGWAENREYA